MLNKFKKLLRYSQTKAEHILWSHLRNRSLNKCKFRSQHVIHGYIVDFVCLEKKLIIELDGSQHANQEDYDNHRTQELEKNGFKVIRFWNYDMVKRPDIVLDVIYDALNENR